MPFLSLIDFNPNHHNEAFDDDIRTIERVDINKDVLDLFIADNTESLILKENQTSDAEIVYTTLKSDKFYEVYHKIKEFYLNYLSKIGKKDNLNDDFETIHHHTLMYSEIINLLKLKEKYENEHIKIRVSY